MFTVRFDNPDAGCHWERQTPSGSLRWGDYQFVVDGDADECDYWVVMEGLSSPVTCRCPPEHTVFMTGEPPSVRTYNPFFLKQFHTVVSSHQNLVHRNVMRAPPALPWRIGLRWDAPGRTWKKEFSKDYDELRSMNDPKKDRLVSVITSDKVVTKAHRLRLSFVKRLEKELGSDLDVFVTSNNSLEDKWEAIGRYRYHIALENGVHPDYWTEKLSDPFLGLAYPIYHGCPNISDYVPEHSYRAIDINDFENSLKVIREVIYSEERERNLDALREAKRLVLDRYNLFPYLADLLGSLPSPTKPLQISLKKEDVIYTRSARSICAGLGGMVLNKVRCKGRS